MAGQDDYNDDDNDPRSTDAVSEDNASNLPNIRQEYDILDSTLDELNSALDVLEQKNDDIHQKLRELLQSNIEIRQEMQNRKVDSESSNHGNPNENVN